MMLDIEPLAPAGYRRIPWKNGRGELLIIDQEGGQTGQDMSLAWHFGRTAIVEEGPFSDYTGYERLQVVIKGAGLLLLAPDHEIDLRVPMQPRRYDGGLPIRTRLENGRVEVVNLIADRARFDIELRVAERDTEIVCRAGRHVVYAPADSAHVEIGSRGYALMEDHALRVFNDTATNLKVKAGHVLVGSIHRNT
jgi:environmental stress-induced protein Ves